MSIEFIILALNDLFGNAADGTKDKMPTLPRVPVAGLGISPTVSIALSWPTFQVHRVETA
jgi:hypothetical protein